MGPIKPVLVTGGTGFVGGHLRSALADDSGVNSVVLLGRSRPWDLRPDERYVPVDLNGPVGPEKLAGGEALCHLAYSMSDGRGNVASNERLLAAVNAAPNVRHVILLSSTSVYGTLRSSLVDEESPCEPIGEYAETKLACEEVWRRGLRENCVLTVLRPSEVIGPGGRGLQGLIRDALHRPALAALKRSVLYHRRLHYVAVSNVVAAIQFALRNVRAYRETFVVSDDDQPENSGYAAMQDAVRRASGKPPLSGPALPRPMLRALGEILGRPLDFEYGFSSQKIRCAGFENAISLRDEVWRAVRSAIGTIGASPRG